jgi:hypothetical protein
MGTGASIPEKAGAAKPTALELVDLLGTKCGLGRDAILGLTPAEQAKLVETQGIKRRALGKWAEQIGIPDAKLDEADEAESPAAAILQLIMQCAQVESSGRPAGTKLPVASPSDDAVGIHSSGAASTRRSALETAFGSLRFGPKHRVEPMAKQLQQAMAEDGADMRIIDMTAGAPSSPPSLVRCVLARSLASTHPCLPLVTARRGQHQGGGLQCDRARRYFHCVR